MNYLAIEKALSNVLYGFGVALSILSALIAAIVLVYLRDKKKKKDGRFLNTPSDEEKDLPQWLKDAEEEAGAINVLIWLSYRDSVRRIPVKPSEYTHL